MGNTITEFEGWAESYDSQPEINRLREAADFSKMSVLEVGCGTGRLTRQIAPLCASYTALEIEQDRLTTATAMTPCEMKTVCARGEYIPIEDEQYDVIIDGWALSSQRVSQALSEYHRVLQTNGVVLCITESWDENKRPDSEYVTLLADCDPGRSWPDIESTLWEPIVEEFPTVSRIPIESSYTFPSVEAAVSAFKYHIEQYNNRVLSHSQELALREAIQHEHKLSDGSVSLSEHATLHIAYC